MTSLAELGIESWSDLGPGENYFVCRCSSTREKHWRKCLAVNRDKGVFRCSHCGWQGRVDGVDSTFQTDTTNWGTESYVAPPTRALEELPQEAVEWFEARGIPETVLERNQIKWGVRGRNPKTDQLLTGIFFPYFRDGQLVNYKWRKWSSKMFLTEKGCELIPYGLDDILPTDTWAIITEGEIDKLSLEVAGFKNVLSVPNGAPPADAKNVDTHLRWFDSPWMEKLHGRIVKWVVCVDSDEPGRKLEAVLSRRLLNERVYVTRMPPECKDANDVLVKYGPEAVREMIDRARRRPVEGIYEAEDPQIVEALEADFLDTNTTPGWSLGFRNLDPYLRLQPGNFVVLTGIPSMGKGEFIDQCAVNLALEYGVKTAFFSPENSPVSRHVRKLIEKYVGLSMKAHYGPQYQMSLETMRAARKWVDEHFTFILPAEGDWTLDNLIKLFEHVVTHKGVQNIVLDPWNEISRSRSGTTSETDAINEELKRLKRFGQQNEILTWVVAHPTKLNPYTGADGSEQYPVPKLYDISGSAHFANRADFGLAVHRDFSKTDENGYENVLEVYVRKARWKDLGRQGKAYLLWDKVSGRLSSDRTHAAPPVAVTTHEDELVAEYEPTDTFNGVEMEMTA